MLYVQFDSAAGDAAAARPPTGVALQLRIRDLHDALDGLELRGSEPAVAIFRFAVAMILGNEAVSAAGWRERGLDTRRGFALVLGERRGDGRWPIGVAAHATAPARLADWLASRGLAARIDGDVVAHGLAAAVDALAAPLVATLATDRAYGQLLVRLRGGGLWGAISRRGMRFQAELVAALAGLPPLHVIARDPPDGADEFVPPDRAAPIALGHAARAAVAPERVGPPSWDEPGPCDCGVPPDLCAMKRFRLVPVDGAAPSPLPGADLFRQLSAAIVDLHEVRRSTSSEFHAGDRVVVARSPESRAALAADDLVLDRDGDVRARAGATDDDIVGAVLMALPWPPERIAW